ncbi:dihydrofolate reductase [Nitriliruptoraceae bacterium ZYF776]|nr:dihydrofolate reductase [Profundirhabdus halotolerans]
MRELSITTFLTLDGVMQGPGSPEEDRDGGFELGGWLVPHFDEQVGAFVDEVFQRAGAIVLGHRTWSMMHPAWSVVSAEDGGATGVALNTLPKHVAGRDVDASAWHDTRPIEGDVVEAVRALKAEDGDGELQVHGSWQLAQTLIAAGLVDRFNLLTFPVVVGSGKELFPDGTPVGLTLESATVTPSGVVCATYLAAGDVRRGAIEGATDEGVLLDG